MTYEARRGERFLSSDLKCIRASKTKFDESQAVYEQNVSRTKWHSAPARKWPQMQ
jgi:hypothetical protein